MPKTTKTYLLAWVEENDELFFDFNNRAASLVKYTKESLLFLLAYQKINFDDKGEIIASLEKAKICDDQDYEEYNEILKKSEMLGKWLSKNSDVKSIYSFFRLSP